MATRNQVDVGLSGQSGSGAFVGNDSPELTNPEIGTILDANGNVVLDLTPQASAVNYLAFTNAPSGSGPSIIAFGSDTNIPITLNSKGTSGFNIRGIQTNGNPPTGYLGEFISSVVASGSAVSLTTATPANITSITLEAGDWNVWGSVALVTAVSTNITQLVAAYNNTSATLPTAIIGSDYNASYNNYAPFVPGTNTFVLPTAQGRLLLASTTTVYLIAQATFTVSTVSAYGMIQARRRS